MCKTLDRNNIINNHKQRGCKRTDHNNEYSIRKLRNRVRIENENTASIQRYLWKNEINGILKTLEEKYYYYLLIYKKKIYNVDLQQKAVFQICL